jgi:hypothetical protein
MKIIIIGGGITGLYIGYMLKEMNIDFTIYEQNCYVGGKMNDTSLYKIYPHFTNMIKLLKNFDTPIILKYNNPILKFDSKLFKKIKTLYLKLSPTNISVDEFIKKYLTTSEYNLFLSYIEHYHLHKMNVKDYFKYNHDNLLLMNQSQITINVDNKIIKYLHSSITNNVFVNHTVNEITYMPLTNKYLLKVNDIFINADKLILTSTMNIRLKIPHIITSQFTNILSYNKQPTKWENTFYINQKEIKTNFYHKYNLILAIHPWLNNLEGSCLTAINTVNIIDRPMYIGNSEYLYKLK